MREITDRGTVALSGFLVLGLLLAGIFWFAANLETALEGLLVALEAADPVAVLAAIVGAILFLAIIFSFAVINPNESIVLLFFGTYIGTLRRPGFWWVIPFTTTKSISLRVVSDNTSTLKVNDSRGNPIEIASVLVWHVADSAKAALNVEDYQAFVKVQSETAVRALAVRYPYDSDDGHESLRGSPDKIAADLTHELKQRLAVAGIEVLEARLSHLAYAPEIAAAMLRRQQAEAVVSARRIITENAVGIVKDALRDLEGTHSFAESERSRLVSNLLVALVSERDAQPVVDLGG